jgi:hypothetical protein
LLDLPSDRFPDPRKTRIRLALLAYCTLTEMDLPYMLIANLLHLRLGNKYHLDPFHDLAQRRPPRKGQAFGTLVPPTARQKIKRISELAGQAKMEAVSAGFEETHDEVLRSAIYHSDFVLHDDSLFIRKSSRLSKKEGGYTPRVALDELDELITNVLHCSARSSPSTSAAGAPSPISGTHSWPTTTTTRESYSFSLMVKAS